VPAALLAASALLNVGSLLIAAAQDCQADSQPLLWEVAKGAQKVFLLAGNNENLEEVQPLPPSIVQAISCADIAYFAIACTPGEEGGLGSFYEHCKDYPVSDSKDAIALRLSADAIFELREALNAVADNAPAECAEEALKVQRIAGKLSSVDYRRSLRMVYIETAAVLDKAKCHVDPFTAGAHTAEGGGFEGWVREQFAATKRPVWGLLDIDDPCKFLSSTTSAEDKGLAAFMSTNFVNATWRARFQQHSADLAQAIKCGDVDRLGQMQDLLHTDVFAKYNPMIAERIGKAMAIEPDKTLLIVLPVTHLFDTPKSSSVPKILSQSGFTVQRMNTDGLTCPKSAYIGSGAKELKLCLMPPGKRQPQTCMDFEDKINHNLAVNPTYGRVVEESECTECFDSSTPCVCSYYWANMTSFNDMCANTEVDGVRGQVWEVDMTRNPGSTRGGKGLTQKVVQASRMMCYATSCSTKLLEEHAKRSWYRNDPELNMGLVVLVKPGTRGSSIVDLFGSWWFLLLFALVCLAVAACLARVFFWKRPRPKPPKRSTPLEPDEGPPAMSRRLTPAPISVYDGNLMRQPFPGSEPKHSLDKERQKRPATAYDSTLLDRVMSARQELADAGAAAVHNMNMQTLQGLQAQAYSSGIMPPQSAAHGSMAWVPQSMGYAAAAAAANAPAATMGSYAALSPNMGFPATAAAPPAMGSYATLPWGYSPLGYSQAYLPPTSSPTYHSLSGGGSSQMYTGH